MFNSHRSLVIFNIWGWNRDRFIHFVDQYINYPMKKYGFTISPEELLMGTVSFILDFEASETRNARYNSPEQAWENLEDYLDSILANFAEDDDEITLHEIDRRRILTAFNDLAEFISRDVLVAMSKSRVAWSAELVDAAIRRDSFTLTFEDLKQEPAW